ncbi:MAG: ATP-binding cassette domain-containing protein [Actinobacteria bacterium]|nr:ATP-binding cassette domain-containing protein [Actinomycetota bacterium]
MIRTTGLVKRYKGVTALDGLDLSVARGTVLALLGPNGAGKTTAVRVLTTLIIPDAGTATVAGIDVVAEPDKVRERIGLSGQTAAVDDNLTGYENLDMVGRLYHLGRRRSRARARELLEQFDLADAGDRPAKTYSGGMRRRLDLAAALVAAPDVLFLDEPTTGLDPRSRVQMWDSILGLVRSGSTALLTTQYMEEADRLADDIVVIDRGRMIAHGTADALKTQIGGERVEIVVAHRGDVATAESVLRVLAVDEVQVNAATRRVAAGVSGGTDALRQVLQQLSDREVAVVDVGLRRPTLDDVFLSLTGHVAEDGEEAVSDDADGTRKSKRRKKERVG